MKWILRKKPTCGVTINIIADDDVIPTCQLDPEHSGSHYWESPLKNGSKIKWSP